VGGELGNLHGILSVAFSPWLISFCESAWNLNLRYQRPGKSGNVVHEKITGARQPGNAGFKNWADVQQTWDGKDGIWKA
jgi:hypothetical protein